MDKKYNTPLPWIRGMPPYPYGGSWFPGKPSDRACEIAQEMGDGWEVVLAAIHGHDDHVPSNYGEVVARFEQGNPVEYIITGS